MDLSEPGTFIQDECVGMLFTFEQVSYQFQISISVQADSLLRQSFVLAHLMRMCSWRSDAPPSPICVHMALPTVTSPRYLRALPLPLHVLLAPSMGLDLPKCFSPLY